MFDTISGAIKSFLSVLKTLMPILLIIGAVIFAPLIFMVAKIVIGFKLFSYYMRIVNVLFQKLFAWIKKVLPGFDGLIKGIKSIGKAVKGFFSSIEKSFSAWEQANLDATKSYEDLAKEIDKTTQKNIAENYELGRKNKTLEKLIKDYEELNSKSIKTDEDIEALENLREEISSISKDFLNADGSVNTSLMTASIEENKEEIRKNLTDNAIEVLRLAKNDIEKFLKDEANINIIGSLLTSGIGDNLELTQDQKDAMSAYYDDLAETFSYRLSSAKTDEEREKKF